MKPGLLPLPVGETQDPPADARRVVDQHAASVRRIDRTASEQELSAIAQAVIVRVGRRVITIQVPEVRILPLVIQEIAVGVRGLEAGEVTRAGECGRENGGDAGTVQGRAVEAAIRAFQPIQPAMMRINRQSAWRFPAGDQGGGQPRAV